MPDERPDPPASHQRRLDSWKEIAAHLRRDVRTVQRWEKTEGLPVHRLRHTHRGAVHAFEDEIDRWWRERSALSPPPDLTSQDSPGTHISRWIAVPAVALAVLAAAWWSVGRTADITSAEIVNGHLVARSGGGEALWSVPIPIERGVEMSTNPSIRSVAVGDLDDDGRREVVVAVRVRQAAETFSTDRLYAFDSNGGVRWMRTRDDRLTFASGEYGPPWLTSDLTVFRAPGGPRIAWTLIHDLWWPSMLVTLDGEGRTDQLFVHAGWLGRVEQMRDGRHLLVGGVSNLHDESVLIALDVAHVGGHWPTPGTRYECIGCPPGTPVRYLRLPRSEGSRGVNLPLLMPRLQLAPTSGFVARIDHDDAAGGSEAIYELSDAFELIRASFSDLYWQRHAQLELTGAIRHNAASCPEREGPVAFAYAGTSWARLQPFAHAASDASVR